MLIYCLIEDPTEAWETCNYLAFDISTQSVMKGRKKKAMGLGPVTKGSL